MRYSILIVLFFGLQFQLAAQDTVVVYFEFGSSKLSSENSDTLGNLSDKYDLSSVDSIQIIGFADSVGKISANLRLSLRRARTVEKACKFTLSEVNPISLYARGEGTLDDPQQNRRVEVILYSKKAVLDAPDSVLNDADPKCFFVDFEALEFCHTRTVQKGKKESIRIEAMDVKEIRERDHYYAQKDSKGAVSVRKVRWKMERTGMLWWKKSRWVTSIPKTAFDQFYFFTLEDAPCDGCKETILTQDTLILTKTEYYSDQFLLDNLQVKVRFFRQNELKIRAPRMYVDESDAYYLNWSQSTKNFSPSEVNRVDWDTKRGKRKQDYYFAEVPFQGDKMANLMRGRQTTECYNVYTGGGRRHWIGCGNRWYDVVLGFQINLDAGAFYQTDTITGFLALGISHTTKKGYARLMGGMNTFAGFYGSGSYQFHYFSFPFQALSPGNKWSSASETKIRSVYGRLYLGAEIKTSSTPTSLSFFEGNLHTGLVVVNANEGSFFPRFYLQGGVGHDFTNGIERKFYPLAQIGCTINISAFKVRLNR